MDLNQTHDPALRSWVSAANVAGCDFPIQNLPFGIFSRGPSDIARGGVAIGDTILDLAAGVESRLFDGAALVAARVATQPQLNALMSVPGETVSALREALSKLLSTDTPAPVRDRVARCLVPMDEASMRLPCHIGDYTDFLTSAHHTERHGRMKGLADPLPAAFWTLPVAYHGRASSIVVSGTPVTRPKGQWKNEDGKVTFGAVDALDFELEFAAVIGQGNPQGQRITLDRAREHIFGYCLLNDWSAKRVQWWEQILGPFLGKSFATTISPWIVTEEALRPFRVPAPQRPAGTEPLPPYLAAHEHARNGGLNVTLEASIQTAAMRERHIAPHRLTRTHLGELAWTFPQMVAHHTVNGCNLRTGDILGSGTISGAEPETMACMTELAQAGAVPVGLDGGEKRSWLCDGDEVTFVATARADGYVPIGFGRCSGRIAPAVG